MLRCLLALSAIGVISAAISTLSQRSSQAAPVILRISPTSGPEGARVLISGSNLNEISAVLFGPNTAQFRIASSQNLTAIVPHKTVTSVIKVITAAGEAVSPFSFAVTNDPRIPDEVSYKAGYVNTEGKPANFTSARLWGIAIADTRARGSESAQVEVAWTRLSCEVNGRQVVLNDDSNRLSGGLYLREPWFGGHDYHEIMPVQFDLHNHSVMLRLGERVDRVWHFWSPSPRASLPSGVVAGCIAKARVKIGPGALLQIGFDYWRSPSVPYGSGGNNHEAGASGWYFPSEVWQEAAFSDIGGPHF